MARFFYPFLLVLLALFVLSADANKNRDKDKSPEELCQQSRTDFASKISEMNQVLSALQANDQTRDYIQVAQLGLQQANNALDVITDHFRHATTAPHSVNAQISHGLAVAQTELVKLRKVPEFKSEFWQVDGAMQRVLKHGRRLVAHCHATKTLSLMSTGSGTACVEAQNNLFTSIEYTARLLKKVQTSDKAVTDSLNHASESIGLAWNGIKKILKNHHQARSHVPATVDIVAGLSAARKRLRKIHLNDDKVMSMVGVALFEIRKAISAGRSMSTHC